MNDDQESQESQSNPADPRAACIRILQHHRNSGGRWPQVFPSLAIGEAADWWLELLEPASDIWDRPKQVSGPSGDRWVYPYVERVTHCLRRFLRAPDQYQREIIAAAEEGIGWRGDSQPLFRMVIAEHERMHELGLEDYKQDTRHKARRLYHPEAE